MSGCCRKSRTAVAHFDSAGCIDIGVVSSAFELYIASRRTLWQNCHSDSHLYTVRQFASADAQVDRCGYGAIMGRLMAYSLSNISVDCVSADQAGWMALGSWWQEDCRMILSILDRYIGRSILSTSLLVLLTLVGLAGIFSFISELDDVGKGSYSVAKAMQYVFLTLPGKAYLLFAPSVLLGSLLGLGALASNSELTVMRAAGVANSRIIRAVLITGFGLMVLIRYSVKQSCRVPNR